MTYLGLNKIRILINNFYYVVGCLIFLRVFFSIYLNIRVNVIFILLNEMLFIFN